MPADFRSHDGAPCDQPPSVGSRRLLPGLAVAVSLLVGPTMPAAAQVTLTEGTNLSADAASADGPVAMDLLGSIWILPSNGGVAEKIINNLQPATQPRWSPAGESILYQVRSALGSQLWLHDRTAETTVRMSDGLGFDQHGDWHPEGQRIVYATQRDGGGFDLRETHLATGLGWSLTSHRGDETWPAWSANGRDLAYVHAVDDEWRLVLRRRGRPEESLLVSLEPLAAPSWRPDGSLITFLRQKEDAWRLEMVILSNPPLVRTLADGEDFFLSPASWQDRMRFYYTADGVIKLRHFNDWNSRPLIFHATVGAPASRPETLRTDREIEVRNPSPQRLLIRTGRLFDGQAPGYQDNVDVVVEDGRIAAIEPRGTVTDATVLDLGDTTLLPGFIDAYAGLQADDQAARAGLGWRLLSYGVTTLIADHLPEGLDPAWWDSPDHAGPRLLEAQTMSAELPGEDDPLPALVTLPAAGLAAPVAEDTVPRWQARGVPVLAESWIAGLSVGADLLLGAETMPSSPQGRRYGDLAAIASNGSIRLVSGLADADTPGLAELLASRQAAASPGPAATIRGYAEDVDLSDATSTVVVGSRPNGLPAGMALHAELRALQAAGLSGDRVLQAAGANAARVLGLDPALGRIAPGAVADLVVVAGDPRARVDDALEIVAVVRSGHFYSLVRLLENARAAASVE